MDFIVCTSEIKRGKLVIWKYVTPEMKRDEKRRNLLCRWRKHFEIRMRNHGFWRSNIGSIKSLFVKKDFSTTALSTVTRRFPFFSLLRYYSTGP